MKIILVEAERRRVSLNTNIEFSRDVTAAMLVSLNKERRPYWCSQLILCELNSILILKFSSVFD